MKEKTETSAGYQSCAMSGEGRQYRARHTGGPRYRGKEEGGSNQSKKATLRHRNIIKGDGPSPYRSIRLASFPLFRLFVSLVAEPRRKNASAREVGHRVGPKPSKGGGIKEA